MMYKLCGVIIACLAAFIIGTVVGSSSTYRECATSQGDLKLKYSEQRALYTMCIYVLKGERP